MLYYESLYFTGQAINSNTMVVIQQDFMDEVCFYQVDNENLNSRAIKRLINKVFHFRKHITSCITHNTYEMFSLLSVDPFNIEFPSM